MDEPQAFTLINRAYTKFNFTPNSHCYSRLAVEYFIAHQKLFELASISTCNHRQNYTNNKLDNQYNRNILQCNRRTEEYLI